MAVDGQRAFTLEGLLGICSLGAPGAVQLAPVTPETIAPVPILIEQRTIQPVPILSDVDRVAVVPIEPRPPGILIAPRVPILQLPPPAVQPVGVEA